MSNAWENIQKKTFTKWCNNHLKKEWGGETKVVDILADWENGILLMKLAVALYKENEKNPEQAIKMPNLKKNELDPKTKIFKVGNCNKAIDLLKKAGVIIPRLSAENLVDFDQPQNKVAILGMVWMLILDYAARGFGGSSSEVKRALLEWVNKKTDGYERVNPPGVKNFTKDWRSGLAFCALIHAHRPELINYDECLTKSNAENLETAFSVAEESLDIPRLLDVEDVDTDSPDDKSIMTYVMEYFHRFASEGLKESAAQQAADWLKFLRDIVGRQNDYERRARELLAWTAASKSGWESYAFGDSKEEADAVFAELRDFVVHKKPPMEAEKLDLNALFAEIQTILTVNNLKPYVPPEEVAPETLETDFAAMTTAQNAHGSAVRENTFKFIEKKDDSAADDIRIKIEESFKKYDTNGNGDLSKSEFEAACMEMGVVTKSQEEKDKLFNDVAQGDDTVTMAEYSVWMRSRLVVSLDNPDGVKSAFNTIADGSNQITANQLATKPFTDEDVAFMKENMTQNEDGTYDYTSFVDKMMV